MEIGRMSGGHGMPVKLACIVLAAGGAAACGADRMPAADTDADLVAHQPPYSAFGEIERLDPAIDALIPGDAELELLVEGLVWAEGPVWVPDRGYLLFSDIPPNSIYRWNEDDGVSLFMRPSGYDGKRTDFPEPGSNGLALDLDGSLLLAEHGNRRIAKLESLAAPNGGRRAVVDRYQGKRLNSPNDLVVTSSGNIYFTDPPYGLATQQVDDPDKELDFQGIYLIRRPEDEIVLLAKQSRPNGIGLSPDERTLYVSNSDGSAPFIYAYDVEDDGTLGARRVFFDARGLIRGGRRGAPDGMTVDAHGNLWAAGPGGILIIDSGGRHLGSLLTGQATANCTFDDEGATLYITADGVLGRLRLD